MPANLSNVENEFFKQSARNEFHAIERIPLIEVKNVHDLGKLTGKQKL